MHRAFVIALALRAGLGEQTLPEGPQAFAVGFAEGLLGNATVIEQCDNDLSKVAVAGARLSHDLGKKNLSQVISDSEQLLAAFHSSVGDCKGSIAELQPFLHVMDGIHSPEDLYRKMKKNFLNNDEAILAAFEGAGKYCTIKDPDAMQCGLSLGRPMRLLLLGDAAQLQFGIPGVAFAAGFAEGLFGSSGVADCAKNLDALAEVGTDLAKDMLHQNMSETMADLQQLIVAFQDSTSDCKDADAQIRPFLQVLDGVKSPADLYQKLKENALKGDIVDTFADARKYCTFGALSGKKCGKSLGVPVRILLLGPDQTFLI